MTSEHNGTPSEPEESRINALMTSAFNRRNFLIGTGAAGVALVGVACGGDSSSSSGSQSSGAPASASATPSAEGDAAVAAVAASLEVLAVATYKGALDAAGANKLGAVPPAVATFATTAMAQHQAALDKWNAVLASAKKPAVTAPPTDLAATVNGQFAKVTDVVGVAKLALLLEQTAADTYLAAIPSLLSKDAITLAGSIQVVDQEHAAILHYVLGEYPVPDVFQKTDLAYSPMAK